MIKKRHLLKLFFIFLSWMGVGISPWALYVQHLNENTFERRFAPIYLTIHTSFWLCTGYFLAKLYFSAYKDELTGLWNRRYLNEILHDLTRDLKDQRADKILSLAILDIDNFKSINDRYGHLFGDEVLKEIAQILQDNLRRTDIIARWGGEEFVIVMPDTNSTGAKAVFERIRSIIEEYDFGCKITISGGIASAQELVQAADLINMADKALYKAKLIKNLITLHQE
ncbi:hypothetical protein TSYNTROOL_16640 [Tepidanaerobacter syntrophicus]|uniref:GGDEF domain-containing protein n=1 Tax=Tepidanaerobacter syntrophicus TaxID=224999 RepID=UPI0022EF1EFC|nr:GGDEF domain-containing protein [Tepidanaerobacter syntrophicus]GLI19949.1 hypothetical protein TSYNTROPHJE_17620 [Tepidanaerobacter syntrophicus]GLI51578.1 hypothetical protein TSYNTROOL_16640 [Tepidanaerobacter syntrophicus]